MSTGPFALYERRLAAAGLQAAAAPTAALLPETGATASLALRVGEVDVVMLAFPKQAEHAAALEVVKQAGWPGAGPFLASSSGGVLLLARAASEDQRRAVDRIAQAFAGEE